MIDDIKKIYPNSKYVGIEVDVSFLGIYRKLCNNQNEIDCAVKQRKYNRFKKLELNALSRLNLIICNNDKDNKLLIENNVDKKKVETVNVFSTSHINFQREKIDKNSIFFFGAMERPENYKSVIWFINNVMCKLNDITFYVIGGNPVDELKKYNSDNIHILGYVDDIKKYFESSLCMVAPLIGGAGIKVKVLEAMSAGVPVLTNKIGIEGIYAQNNIDYLLCLTPEDYIEKIRLLQKDDKLLNSISINSRAFYCSEYDNAKSAEKFIELLDSI